MLALLVSIALRGLWSIVGCASAQTDFGRQHCPLPSSLPPPSSSLRNFSCAPPPMYALDYPSASNIALATSDSSSYLWLYPDPVLPDGIALVGIEPNPGPKGKAPKPAVVVVQAPAKKKKKKASGGGGGGSVGKSIGSKVGGWVGDLASKALMAITGFGDYKVTYNSLVNSNQVPQFSITDRKTLIRKREFVGTVTSPGSAFTTTPFLVNPTTPLFPWLSELAPSFEQFRIHGMIVDFVSTSATAVSSTNTALGSVIIATQYNTLAPAFASQQQMENYEFCTSCAPSCSMIHPLECAPGLTTIPELYVDINYGGDIRFGALGVVVVATVGQQAASVVGELWVSYDIELLKPKVLSGTPTGGFAYSLFTNRSSGDLNNPFGGLAAEATARGPFPNGSDLAVTFPSTVTASNNVIQFPYGTSGTYLVIMYGNGTSTTTAQTGPFQALNGLSIPNYFATGGTDHTANYTATPAIGTAATLWTFSFMVTMNPAYPLFGGLSSVANGLGPAVVVPQLVFPSSTSTRLFILPVSFI